MVGILQPTLRDPFQKCHGPERVMPRSSIHSLLAPAADPKVAESKGRYYGRAYYDKWIDVYPFPCDEGDKERMDALHNAFYNVALEEKLHIASLNPGRLRILDVGSGTGIWAVSMAAKYPHAEVIAIDLGNDHPQREGINFGVKFISGVDFTTDDWGLAGEAPFDFIHMGQLCGSVADWDAHFRRAHRLLRYGGQIESVELDWTPRCIPDAAVPPNSPIRVWWHQMQCATLTTGKHLAYPTAMEDILENAGFVVVNHRVVTVHASEDMHLSPDDMQNRLARWYRYTMFTPIFDTLRGMSMALFNRRLGQSPEQISALCNEVNSNLNSVNSPVFHKLHVVTAQKKR